MASDRTTAGVAVTLRPTGAGENVQVAKASNTPEYERSLQIVLGTVFGVFGFLGILIVVTLLYRFCKNRRRTTRSGSSDRNTSQHRSVSIDLEQKQVPAVLLLYSNDCSAHQKVVEALAGFLIETCNCNVHVDMFEEQIIHDRGLDDWLVEKLQEAEFIIVLCSIGARLRCSKKKVRFKFDPNRTLPDYFAVAVDYVAEKMRVERSKEMPLTAFISVYMDYSTASDIPPQLEMAFKFCLMKDISALFCHLHGINGEPTKDGVPVLGLSEETYDVSEMGTELRVAIESAKEFFRCNPEWVEESMEQAPLLSKSKLRHFRKSSYEPLLGPPEKHILPPKESKQSDSKEKSFLKFTKTKQDLPPKSLQNNQNSCPSALGDQLKVPSPALQSLNSRSCENFQTSIPRCDLCGKDWHATETLDCKGSNSKAAQEIEMEEMDSSSQNSRSKSKSMPTMNRHSLYSSQTVFQAEVHKEWDETDDKMSQADSQDTASQADSIIDDLERDLHSIVNPINIMCDTLSHGDTIPGLETATQLAMIPPTLSPSLVLPSIRFCDETTSGSVEIECL